MITGKLNPYETPRLVDPSRRSDDEGTGRRHHLSNRFMSLVLGIPGALFASAGTLYFSVAVSMPASSPAIAMRPICFSIGIVGLCMGAGMLAASVYLWRYDSTHN